MGVHVPYHRKKNLVVVQYHDGERTFKMAFWLVLFLTCNTICRVHGNFHGETAASAFFTFQSDCTVHHVHDAFDYGQTQPEAVLRGGIREPFKLPEHPLPFFIAHAAARVFHDDGKRFPVIA